MGTILSGYGDTGYGHEGYVGQLLDDDTITGTYSSSTIPRMTGHVIAACGLLTATVGEDDGVTLTAAVREGRRPRPGVPDGALVVGLAV